MASWLKVAEGMDLSHSFWYFNNVVRLLIIETNKKVYPLFSSSLFPVEII
jgi:hypothetical protein